MSEEESREQIEEIINNEEPVKEQIMKKLMEKKLNQNRNLKPAESEPNQKSKLRKNQLKL